MARTIAFDTRDGGQVWNPRRVAVLTAEPNAWLLIYSRVAIQGLNADGPDRASPVLREYPAAKAENSSWARLDVLQRAFRELPGEQTLQWSEQERLIIDRAAPVTPLGRSRLRGVLPHEHNIDIHTTRPSERS